MDDCQHNYMVFSTALTEGWLMLQCRECGAHATVEKPTPAEWQAAFHAPSAPYPWPHNDRVTPHPEVPRTRGPFAPSGTARMEYAARIRRAKGD